MFHDKPLPFLPLRASMTAIQSGDLTAFEPAVMPLGHINGPVMIIAGGDDQMALSGLFLPLAEKKLGGRPQAVDDRVLYFSDAGHLIDLNYQPTTQRSEMGPYTPVGGTPQGYARASAVSGPAVLAFLRSALK